MISTSTTQRLTLIVLISMAINCCVLHQQQPQLAAASATQDVADSDKTPIDIESPIDSIDSNSGPNKLETQPRALQRMLNFIGWDQYKSMFGKVYTNWADECRRKSLFLARLVGTFVHNVLYLRRTFNYFTKINAMSDMTHEEEMKLFAPVNGQEPDFDTLNRMLSNTNLAQKSQTIIDTPNDQVNIDQVKTTPEEAVEKGNDGISGKMKSFFSSMTDAKALSKSVENAAVLLTTPFVMAHGKLVGEQNKADKSHLEENNSMKIDYRTSECVPQPRNQFMCGACYAFATIFVLEFELCRRVGQIVPLSEQYVVDCSHSAPDITSYGCGGAVTHMLHSFYNQYGVALRKNGPYRGSLGQCPYNINDKSQQKQQLDQQLGDIRVHTEMFEVAVDSFDKRIDQMLLDSPVMVAMKTPSTFQSYGGGVHDGGNCQSRPGRHAMVIIGQGVDSESNEPFYLIRNSFGMSYGEKGNFRLSKSGAVKCITAAFTWLVAFNGQDVRSLRAKFAKNATDDDKKIDQIDELD